MQSQETGTGNLSSSRGYGAYTSAIIALVALVAAYRPDWQWLATLNARAPELTVVLPVVLGPLGIIGATLSRPPHWLCEAWARVWEWVKSRFGKRSAAA